MPATNPDEFTRARIMVARSLWQQIRNTLDGPAARDTSSAIYSRIKHVAVQLPPLYRLAAGGTVIARRKHARFTLPPIRRELGRALGTVLWRAITGSTLVENGGDRR